MLNLETAADHIASHAASLASSTVDEGRARTGTLAVVDDEQERDERVASTVQQLRCLSDAMRGRSERLFVDYIEWARTVAEARSRPQGELVEQLDCLRTVLDERLPEGRGAADSFLRAAVAQLAQPMAEQSSLLAPDSLAARYLARLLAYDRQGAIALVDAALASGTSIRDVYLEIIQRTQHEIGRLWQLNRVSVAQEHYCTAISQLVLAQLYPRLMHTPRGDASMVSVCVSDELHELGGRMVADFFEMDGWDTTYIGASTPPEDTLQMMYERDASLLAISVTMTFHLQAAAEIIRAVRADPELPRVKILVGGRPFCLAGNLWRNLGADGTANDAAQAVAVGNRLVGRAPGGAGGTTV